MEKGPEECQGAGCAGTWEGRESRKTTFREEHTLPGLGTMRSISEPGVKGEEETCPNLLSVIRRVVILIRYALVPRPRFTI